MKNIFINLAFYASYLLFDLELMAGSILGGSSELGNPKVVEYLHRDSSDFHWVGLQKVVYTDKRGETNIWEGAYRKPEKPAVAIFATVHGPHIQDQVIIIHEFRPLVERKVVALPAGLIDDANEVSDEIAVAHALRELLEETGYGGKKKDDKGDKDGCGVATVTSVSRILPKDPGMTSATMILVCARVEVGIGEKPEQKLDKHEEIEVELIPFENFVARIHELSKSDDRTIDSNLMHIVKGIELSQQFPKLVPSK